MGYKPDKKLYNLEFEDYPGLHVTAKSATLGEFSYITQLKIDLQQNDDKKRMEVFEFFAGKLQDWDIDHPELPRGKDRCPNCDLKEDDPMPPTVKSMECLDLDLLMAIIMGWVFAIARVSAPKGMSLKGGEQLTETVMRELEKMQNPLTLPEPNFS